MYCLLWTSVLQNCVTHKCERKRDEALCKRFSMTHRMREGVINNTEERENRWENKRGRNGA